MKAPTRPIPILNRSYPEHRQAIGKLAGKMKVSEEEAIARLAELALEAAGLTQTADVEAILKPLYGKGEKFTEIFNALADAHNEVRNTAMEIESADRDRWARTRKAS